MNNNTMISQLSIVPRNALRVSATLRNRALDFFGNFFIQTSETRTNGLSRNGYSILIPRLVETDRNIRTHFTIYLAFIYFNLVLHDSTIYLTANIILLGCFPALLLLTVSRKILWESRFRSRKFGISHWAPFDKAVLSGDNMWVTCWNSWIQ